MKIPLLTIFQDLVVMSLYVSIEHWVFFIFSFVLSREDAMKVVIDNLSQKDVVISATGMLSRELFEYR